MRVEDPKRTGLCSEVEIEPSRSRRIWWPATRALRRTGQPRRPGGLPMAAMELLPALTSACRMPAAFRIADRAIHRVSLADSAEVDLHAVGPQANPIGSAQSRSCRSRRTAARRQSRAAEGARPSACAFGPDLEQRRDRDVELPAGAAGNHQGLLDDLVQARLDGHERRCGRRGPASRDRCPP